jgi:hypothetical protein
MSAGNDVFRRTLASGPPAMRRLTLATTVFAMLAARLARADVVVQIPIDPLLNGRPVSTFTGGKVIPWTAGQGLDATDGLVTIAAENALGQTGTALPDDGTFAADADHPLAMLHFSNDASAASPQTHFLKGAGDFQFAVPQATYSKLFLYMTSSYGASPLTITTTYANGQPSTTSFMLPDWGTGQPLPTSPPIFFNLISGMHKWTAGDQQVDSPVHTITGVTISPDSSRTLTSVQVNSSATMQDLIFWGATGLATNPIDAGTTPPEAGSSSDGNDAAVDDASSPSNEVPEASSGSGSSSGGAGASGSAEASGGAGASAGSTADSVGSTGSMQNAASGAAPSDMASGRVSPADSASGTATTRQPASAGCAIAPAPRNDGPLGICAFAFAIARRRQRRARV